ncbi:MAG: TlpA family protein disulfide reductase [Paramuribaculum sp.]|nr:TlpA family protein disulfide reductase [Paramuribaculum sp.]
MKKLIFLTALTITSALCHAKIEKYYLGNAEISRDNYLALDTTLLGTKEQWTEADTLLFIVNPGIYARIDSISVPGRIYVARKSDKEIAEIDSILNSNRTASAIMKPGDTIPDFTFHDFLFHKREPWNYRDLLAGNVILLNFWATWCGPCVEELKPEHLPSLLEEFRNHDNFIFLPVSVNHSNQELIDFFESPRGKELGWIEYTTAWDKNGEFSKTLSGGGLPLTILIDENGVIRLNESGAFLTDEKKAKLKNAIASLLR